MSEPGCVDVRGAPTIVAIAVLAAPAPPPVLDREAAGQLWPAPETAAESR